MKRTVFLLVMFVVLSLSARAQLVIVKMTDSTKVNTKFIDPFDEANQTQMILDTKELETINESQLSEKMSVKFNGDPSVIKTGGNQGKEDGEFQLVANGDVNEIVKTKKATVFVTTLEMPGRVAAFEHYSKDTAFVYSLVRFVENKFYAGQLKIYKSSGEEISTADMDKVLKKNDYGFSSMKDINGCYLKVNVSKLQDGKVVLSGNAIILDLSFTDGRPDVVVGTVKISELMAAGYSINIGGKHYTVDEILNVVDYKIIEFDGKMPASFNESLAMKAKVTGGGW